MRRLMKGIGNRDKGQETRDKEIRIIGLNGLVGLNILQKYNICTTVETFHEMSFGNEPRGMFLAEAQGRKGNTYYRPEWPNSPPLEGCLKGGVVVEAQCFATEILQDVFTRAVCRGVPLRSPVI